MVTLDDIFLYSVIARPGNSGDPIISSPGHVLGIVTKELTEESLHSSMPFHAAVKSGDIKSTLSDLEPSVVIPIENYE